MRNRPCAIIGYAATGRAPRWRSPATMPRTTVPIAANSRCAIRSSSSGPRSWCPNETYASRADPAYPMAPLAASPAYPWKLLCSTVFSVSPATPSPIE